MRKCFAPIAIAGSLLVVSCGKNTDVVILLGGPGTEAEVQTGTGTETAPESEPAVPVVLDGALVSVPAGSVLSGFKHGQLRKRVDIGAFSISRHPVTVGQYRTCIDAEVCKEQQQECANGGAAEQDAALCVGEENARAYCAWGGGRLASLEEWLLASRGVSPQRFAWGDTGPTCEQHPLGLAASQRGLLEASASAQAPTKTMCGKPLAQRYEVGQHTEGASPYGVEDVLIARQELLGGEPSSHFTACARGGRSCLVYGLIPGAIDAVKLANEAGSVAIEDTYAFRCVWSKEGS